MCVDVIEDCIDGDKDVIMKLTDIVFVTYIINAFAPKQVDIGLANSAEYTILVCCDASYLMIYLIYTYQPTRVVPDHWHKYECDE